MSNPSLIVLGKYLGTYEEQACDSIEVNSIAYYNFKSAITSLPSADELLIDYSTGYMLFYNESDADEMVLSLTKKIVANIV